MAFAVRQRRGHHIIRKWRDRFDNVFITRLFYRQISVLSINNPVVKENNRARVVTLCNLSLFGVERADTRSHILRVITSTRAVYLHRGEIRLAETVAADMRV